MNGDNSSKLNRLLQTWPQGTVAVLRWLETQGVYQQLVHGYEKSGWVKRVGQGAWMRAGDTVKWSGGLHTVQEQMRLPVHVGAKTALQMQGYAHFLALGKGGSISLFGTSGTRLPAWFRRYDWAIELRYTTTNLFAADPDSGLSKIELPTYTIAVAAPERAIMEVLYLVPVTETFEEASLLMEGLTTLRPRLIQSLLEQCGSIKVKRLFMFLAEACNHAWVKNLDLSKVCFGQGKRMIVKGGRLDTKYNITVPNSAFERQGPGGLA